VRGGPGLRNLTRTTLDGEREGWSHILYCIVLYINSGILFEDRSGGRCRCRRPLFLRHLYLESLPRTYFSPRQHGTVQARASTATARPGAAPDHDQDRQAQQAVPGRARRRSRGAAAGAWGRGGHRPAAADHAWPAEPIITILYSCNRAALSAVKGRALGRRLWELVK